MDVIDPAGLGLPVGAGILGIQANLDRMALRFRGFGWQMRALGDVQLPRDQVEPTGLLCNGMFDLQPGVHLQEEEPSVVVGEELDGPGSGVTDGRGSGHRGIEEFAAQCGADSLHQR